MTSRALPFVMPLVAGMSNSTTSPSCFCAHCSASCPPMLPAPMRAIFLRAIVRLSCRSLHRSRSRGSHLLDDGVAELGAAHLAGALHQPREVVGHGLRL